MRITFGQAEDYLIGADDGKSISKDHYYVTKIAVPRQMPDDSYVLGIEEEI